MAKREQQRHSSLPSSVIPHLLRGPQTTAERSVGVRSSTSPIDAREGDTVELNPPRQHQSSGSLPPISSIPEARARTISFTNRSTESPEPEDIHERETREYTPPSVFHGPVAGPSSIPHGQTQRFPIRSDPSFHASSSRSTGYRSAYGFPPPSPQISLPPLRPISWGEGDAGTSSLGPTYQTRASGPYSPPQVEWDRQIFRVGGHQTAEERREGHGERSNPGQSRSVRDNRDARSPYVSEFSGAQPEFSSSVRIRNDDSPSIPAFEHLHVGVQEPRPHLWPASPGAVFSLEEPIIPGRRRSEADVPPYASRPEKGQEGQDVISPVQSGKRRRDSDDSDDGKRKAKVPRKIYVACDFCRGRKLRCDGNKPTCWNCISRKRLCVYQPYPRRRGPGKAPKGTRSKKRAEGHLPSIDTFNPQIVVPERRKQGTIDTLPPYAGEETPPPYLPSTSVQASSSRGPSVVESSESVTAETSQTQPPESYDEDDESEI